MARRLRPLAANAAQSRRFRRHRIWSRLRVYTLRALTLRGVHLAGLPCGAGTSPCGAFTLRVYTQGQLELRSPKVAPVR